MSDLQEVIDRLKKQHGKLGVVIINQHVAAYVAVAMGPDGTPCDPRSWGCHETPEGAIADLLRILRSEEVKGG